VQWCILPVGHNALDADTFYQYVFHVLFVVDNVTTWDRETVITVLCVLCLCLQC